MDINKNDEMEKCLITLNWNTNIKNRISMMSHLFIELPLLGNILPVVRKDMDVNEQEIVAII